MQQLNSSLDADLPRERVDSFNREHFSQFVLNTIKQCPVGSSFVVGIEGEWGSGKTFVFEQIKTLIAAHQNENAEFGVCTIDYSPWLVSGKHAIVQELLRVLSRHLLTTHALRGNGEKIAKLIGQFAGALGAAGSIAAGGIDFGLIALLSRDVSKKAKQVESFLKPNESPQHLKSEIIKALAEVNEKTVVFIDDLDRLPPNEIRDLFQAIKSVADFPNVIYVLGYDRKIVTNSLTDTASDFDGVHYLEKIVQLPMPLPRLGERDLVVFLENQLNSMEYDFSKSVPERVKGVLIPSGQLLKTPRTVVRLCNSLRMLTMQLEGEIDAVDLLAIELIRFCAPDLWKMIHDEPEVLTGSFSPADFVQGRNYYVDAEVVAAYKSFDDRKGDAEKLLNQKLSVFSPAVMSIHRLLFPKAFSESTSNVAVNPRRLSNPDRLAYYFSQASSNWVFPIKVLQHFVSAEGMKKFFENATYFDFCYRAEKTLEVKSEIGFNNNPKQILLEIAHGLEQFDATVFIPNNQLLRWDYEFEFIAELLLAQLCSDSSFSEPNLQKLMQALPFSYICHFQRCSSIRAVKPASTRNYANLLESDERYKRALNAAFLSLMTAADLPEKITAHAQSVPNNFYYFAELTSLQEARKLFAKCSQSHIFLKGLVNESGGHDRFNHRFFKFINDFDCFKQRFVDEFNGDEGISNYLNHLQNDETKALWQREFEKGMNSD